MNNEISERYSIFKDGVLLIMRLIIAAVFLFAAYAKLSFWSTVPFDTSPMMVNLIKLLSIVEPLGALALIVGFLTRWAAGGLAIIMVGAILVLSITAQTAFFTSSEGTGLDYNALLLLGCLTLLVFGPGKWSIDALHAKNS